MTTRTDIRVPLESGLETAVTIVAPDDPNGRVLFGFPGGGYNRHYYDLSLPGGYSQAQWHAARGWTVVCCDHLGVGESSQPDPESLTFEVLADANQETVEWVVDHLDLAGPVVGMGQSMGGCLLVVQQARHQVFDAIAILGFSAVHTVLPLPEGGLDIPPGLSMEESILLTTKALSYAFHYSDVPQEIVQEDIAGFPLRTGAPAWASASVPPAAASMLDPGVIAKEAAVVDVPVLVVAGEIDVNMDLPAEAAAYASAAKVETMLLPRAAHMHNFASTRQLLWERLDEWTASLN